MATHLPVSPPASRRNKEREGTYVKVEEKIKYGLFAEATSRLFFFTSKRGAVLLLQLQTDATHLFPPDNYTVSHVKIILKSINTFFETVFLKMGCPKIYELKRGLSNTH
jgi:hypothetical protein